jgi:hypothetical protein
MPRIQDLVLYQPTLEYTKSQIDANLRIETSYAPESIFPGHDRCLPDWGLYLPLVSSMRMFGSSLHVKHLQTADCTVNESEVLGVESSP